MRQLFKSTLALSLALAVLTPAARAESPWYLGTGAGAYLREPESGATTFSNAVKSAPGSNRISFNPGALATISVGYRIMPHFRIEGEFGYAGYDAQKANPVSSAFAGLDGSDFKLTSGGGEHRYMATMNGFFDLPVEGAIVPFVGVGIGYEHGNASAAQFVSASGVRFSEGAAERDTGVGLLEGGLTVAVTDRWAIVPAYRYVHFFANANHFGDEVAHIFKLGVRYSF